MFFALVEHEAVHGKDKAPKRRRRGTVVDKDSDGRLKRNKSKPKKPKETEAEKPEGDEQ